MRTWGHGEALVVRQLLDCYGIPCQLVSDVPHSVLPMSLDGLGEVRILVVASVLSEARALVAAHRRHGLRLVPGGRSSF
jgi:hypothetical protein